MTRNYIGVDLSKDWLDICDPRRGVSRIANTEAGIRDWLRRIGAEDLVVFEATSLCDGRLMRLATAVKQPFHRLNPLHGWHFARSLNLPKTDRVDAAMLSRMGAERRLERSPGIDPARAELAELNGRRDQLKRMETQEKNRLGKAVSQAVRDDIRHMLVALGRRIQRAEARIERFLARHSALARQVGLLESIPGIGRVCSVTILSLMPELGLCDRRAVASLGGLAPRARESGKWIGRRYTGEGRRQVRRAMYMSSLSSMRHGRLCPEFVDRLRASGKPGKVVAIAVARKLLTIANAVLRDQTPFQPRA